MDRELVKRFLLSQKVPEQNEYQTDIQACVFIEALCSPMFVRYLENNQAVSSLDLPPVSTCGNLCLDISECKGSAKSTATSKRLGPCSPDAVPWFTYRPVATQLGL